jgi:AcrR family transcriptional regulator
MRDMELPKKTLHMYTNIKTEAVKLSITIEHEKRKREILEKALDVFVDEGYEDTTFQKIAERCGITRTILYLYFKNKREIFSFSIKLFMEKLELSIREIVADAARSQSDKLSAILGMVVETCSAQRRLLTVILDYLGHIRAAGGDPDERVRRRTIRMRHILAGVLIEGQKKGDFPPFSVKVAGDLIYSLIEAAIFRIAVLGHEDVSVLVEAAALLGTSLRSSEPRPRGRPSQGPSRPAASREGRAS